MKRNRDVMLRLGYSILLVFALFISACATKLIDIERSVPGLNLSKEQMEVVEPKMRAIRDMVEMYNEDKEQLEEELSSMMGSGMGGGKGRGRSEGGSGFREKFEALRKKREAYLSAINIHVTEIKAVLNEEQLVTFEKMKMPELETPETPGGRRRGGTGGRRGGGMGGGRGGGRGGGMF